MNSKYLYLLLVATFGSTCAGCESSPSQATIMLFEAAQEGDVKKMEELVDRGADVNATDDKGNTPLHYTSDVTREKLSSMRKLSLTDVEPGVAVALGIVEFDGYEKCATFLITNGASLNTRNNNGNTPLALAIRANNNGVIEILRSHGAQE